MPVTHAFVSAVADGSDATLVRPSNWNASHSGHDDLSQINSEPPASDTIASGWCAIVMGLPYIIDSGVVITIAANGVLAILP